MIHIKGVFFHFKVTSTKEICYFPFRFIWRRSFLSVTYGEVDFEWDIPIYQIPGKYQFVYNCDQKFPFGFVFNCYFETGLFEVKAISRYII